jgi:hypothetical protein
LIVLVTLLFAVLVGVLIREDRLLHHSLDMAVAQKQTSFSSTSGTALFAAVAFTAGNAFMMHKTMKGARAASNALLKYNVPRPPTWFQRKFPLLHAIKPTDKHEIVLYAINFFMIYQGVSLWRGWVHSPARAAVMRWQASGISRFLRHRELRLIQRKAAMELAKSAKPVAQALGGARGGALVKSSFLTAKAWVKFIKLK